MHPVATLIRSIPLSSSLPRAIATKILARILVIDTGARDIVFIILQTKPRHPAYFYNP